jgi:hypothetical protein
MALTIEANYSKKVGLPGYSSHQFSLSLKSELTDLNQVPAEAARLYRLLQDGVDASLQDIGWLPESKSNGHSNGHTNGHANGNGQPPSRQWNGVAPAPARSAETWNCTPKQQDFILQLVEENHLDKNEVEQLAQERFGKGVKQLTKLDASGFIEELTQKYPRQRSTTPPRSNYTVR